MEARFEHLLRPIRDLAENWNIDIASHLEEYLSELENIAFTIDGGKTTMNFIEAALLIQGTACIYSRKVEHLHALVCQALELLSNRKKQAIASSIDAAGQDKDVSMEHACEFLSLDDIREGKSLDLRPSEYHSHATRVRDRTSLFLGSFSKFEEENRSPQIINADGESVGRRSDFKMMSTLVNERGAIVMEQTHLYGNTSVAPSPPRPPVVEFTHTDISWDGGPDVSFDNDHPPQETVGGGNGQPPETPGAAGMREPPPPPSTLWVPYSPYARKDKGDKTCRIGYPFTFPSVFMESNPKLEKRKRARRPQKPPPPSLLKCLTAFLYRTDSHSKLVQRNHLKTCSFPELGILKKAYIAEEKSRKRNREQERRLLVRFCEECPQFYQEKKEEDDGGRGRYDDADDYNDYGGEEGEDGIDHLHEDKGLEAPDPLMGIAYENAMKRHLAPLYDGNSQQKEELGEWEEAMKAKLAMQGKRPPFDMQKYSQAVVSQLEALSFEATGTSDSPVPFTGLTSGQEAEEVCRIFMTSLHLAGSGNVKIFQEEAPKDPELTLVNKELSLNKFEEYRVPSQE